MLRYTWLFTLSCLAFILLNGQAPPLRTIEVIGYAQVDILPNEIYYSVTLSDKLEGRDLISLQSIQRP